MRARSYARYSSDLQSGNSIADQHRLNVEYIVRQGWQDEGRYADEAMSGASMMRPGLQRLLDDVAHRRLDVIVVESIDRLSRGQADIARIFERCRFHDVSIHSLADGEITNMHVGLKGTMSAIYLQDLADKTRRGLRGRVEAGKSAGGKAYGYDVVKRFDADGTPIRGDRTINEVQAAIVRRIFSEYADGRSAKAIAERLNAEKVPSPSGRQWAASTINGNRRRGIGILNQELYAGTLVWNRQRFIKDPETGRRQARLNPENEWQRHPVPELRIVDDELWQRVRARQRALDARPALHEKRRPKYLLSGLVKCGRCGGGYSKISRDRLGCSNARNKGFAVCTNRRTIRQDELEERFLSALQTRLMDPELVEVFCDEYARHMAALRSSHNSARRRLESERASLKKQIDSYVAAIGDGADVSLIKDALNAAGQRVELIGRLLDVSEDKPLLHPQMARRYRETVTDLRNTLVNDGELSGAGTILRSLVDKIVITPGTDGQRTIDLYGNLAAILRIASGTELEMDEVRQVEEQLARFGALAASEADEQIVLVAGAGFEPATFGL